MLCRTAIGSVKLDAYPRGGSLGQARILVHCCALNIYYMDPETATLRLLSANHHPSFRCMRNHSNGRKNFSQTQKNLKFSTGLFECGNLPYHAITPATWPKSLMCHPTPLPTMTTFPSSAMIMRCPLAGREKSCGMLIKLSLV